jgi:hypothetical protein
MLAPRPTLHLFLGLWPARNQQLGPVMSYISFTFTSFKNLNYICNCIMLVSKILDKFKVYFDGVLKYTFCANWVMLKQNKLIVTTRTQIWHCEKFRPLFFRRIRRAFGTSDCHVCPLVCQQTTTRHPPGRFSWDFIFRIFNWKFVLETLQLWLKSCKITMPYVTTYVNVILYNCDRLCSLWGTILIRRNSWWDTLFLVRYELRPKK